MTATPKVAVSAPLQTPVASVSSSKWPRDRVRNEFLEILEAIGTKWSVELKPTVERMKTLQKNAELYDLVMVGPELYQHHPQARKHFDSFFLAGRLDLDGQLKKKVFFRNFRKRVEVLLQDQNTFNRVLRDLQLEKSHIQKLFQQNKLQDLTLYFLNPSKKNRLIS